MVLIIIGLGMADLQRSPARPKPPASARRAPALPGRPTSREMSLPPSEPLPYLSRQIAIIEKAMASANSSADHIYFKLRRSSSARIAAGSASADSAPPPAIPTTRAPSRNQRAAIAAMSRSAPAGRSAVPSWGKRPLALPAGRSGYATSVRPSQLALPPAPPPPPRSAESALSTRASGQLPPMPATQTRRRASLAPKTAATSARGSFDAPRVGTPRRTPTANRTHAGGGGGWSDSSSSQTCERPAEYQNHKRKRKRF